jgi:hypothetical protein
MSTPEDTLGAALRDFALDQLAHVDLQLARAGAWQHEGVHLARKGIARLRACLELLHKSPLVESALERRMRSFAHALSPLRDTQAALATAKELRRHGRDKGEREIWRALSADLKARRERVLGAALMTDPGFAEHRAQVAEMRSAIAMIPWTRLLESDLYAALKRAAKRARRTVIPACESTAELARHRCRRRHRRLLLQIELLQPIAHDEARPRAAAAARSALYQVLGKSLRRKQRKHVIDTLGWEQDLRVLRRALPGRATTASVRRAVTALRDELEQAQADTNSLLE